LTFFNAKFVFFLAHVGIQGSTIISDYFAASALSKRWSVWPNPSQILGIRH